MPVYESSRRFENETVASYCSKLPEASRYDPVQEVFWVE